MIDQRPQDRGGGGAAERADEGPVIVAGPTLPAAVLGGHPRGVVEQERSLGKHMIPPIVPRHIMAAPANSMRSEVMVLRLQLVAPLCPPGFCSPCGEVPRTGTFQISSADSRMVRSEENHGIRATLRIEARVHAGTTCQRASMPRWAS